MIAPLKRFLSVFTLVSRIPLRFSQAPDFSRADFWLPIVGVPAAAAGVCGFLAARLLFKDQLLVAIAALACQYWAFNLFHLDGLLDSADAMAGQATPERRLEILKDPRLGSFAFYYGFLVLAAKIAALAALARLAPAWAMAGILGAAVAGRAGSALVPLLARPARSGGLGALMRGFSPIRVGAGWLAGSLTLLLFALSPQGWPLVATVALASLASAIVSGLVLSSLYRRKIGGFTGDALGAAVELGELLALLCALAATSWLG